MKLALATLALALVSAATTQAAIVISEVHPSGSGNAPYAADFFELTNNGPSAVTISGWKVDDDSNSASAAITLTGVSSIAAGQSVVFAEVASSTTAATVIANFKSAWFGANVPAGFTMGTYQGSGIGLSTAGDQVNIFDAANAKVTGVRFGAATANVTFDNAAGIGSATASPPPLIAQLSVVGVNNAFSSVGSPSEIGSPGLVPEPTSLAAIGVAAAGVVTRRRKA